MPVEDEFMDVLQNIEFAVVQEFRRDRTLLDLDARSAVNALIRRYEAEEEGRKPAAMPLGHKAQRVLDSVLAMCEWRLGRASGPSPKVSGEPAPSPHTVAEIVLCLKRIRKSIDRWDRELGKQGYLKFVSQYIV